MRATGAAIGALLTALASVGAGAERTPCSWPMYGRDPGHSFAQVTDCSLITPANAPTLGVKWFIPTHAPVTASPSVVDGFVYVGDWDGKFYKIQAESGAIVWTFQVDDTHRVPFGRIVSSAAVDTIRVGKEIVPVVLFGGGATLYALDPGSGVLLAKQDLDPRDAATRAAHEAAGISPELEIESSPVVGHLVSGNDDRIFVGMDVHNQAGVGRAGLLSLKLRKDARGPTPYRFELVYKFDPETRLLRRSFTEGSGTGWGCGGVWSSPALDPAALGGGSGVVVFGTSNCNYPVESPVAGEVGREGVFGIRAWTGELLWEFHPRPPNLLDDDFGASPNLLPGGAVGNGGKDGWYYAFDRVSGAERWRSHPAQSGHLTPEFAFGGIIGTPAFGEVRGEPALFIVSALSTTVGDPGPPPLPDPTLAEDAGRMRSLHAIRSQDGALLWRSSLSRPGFGAPTFARGVLFVPSTLDLSVKAFDVNSFDATGEPLLLWEHPLDGAPASAPAIVGDSIYLGAGTTAEGLPLDQASGIWAFELAGLP